MNKKKLFLITSVVIIVIISITLNFVYNHSNQSPSLPTYITENFSRLEKLPFLPDELNYKDTDYIHWKSDFHLKISDFKGKPDYKMSFVAWTTPQIMVLHFNDIQFVGSYPNMRYSISGIQIDSIFNGDQSWYKVNQTICNNETSQQLLDHEQGHFDLNEEFARMAYSKASNEFNNKTFSGEGNSSIIQQNNAYLTTWKTLGSIRDQFQAKFQLLDGEYERFTHNGCNWQAQKEYNDFFQNLLRK